MRCIPIAAPDLPCSRPGICPRHREQNDCLRGPAQGGGWFGHGPGCTGRRGVRADGSECSRRSHSRILSEYDSLPPARFESRLLRDYQTLAASLEEELRPVAERGLHETKVNLRELELIAARP